MPPGTSEFENYSAKAFQAFAVLSIAYIGSQFFRVSNAVIAPELMADLAISPTEIGAITGIFFFTFALMQIPTGILLDRFGPRTTMSGLLLIAVAGAFLFANASSTNELFTGRALIGVGCAAGLMGSMVAIARWFPADRFATMSSWLFIIGGIGTLLATSPLAALTNTIGWRGAFVLMAIATLVMAVLIFAIVRDHPPGAVVESESETVGEILAGMREVLGNRNLWHISCLQFVAYASILTISGLWGGPYLSDIYGMDGVARGNVLFAINVATLVGVLAFSALDRKMGSRKRTVGLGAVISIGILAVLAMAPSLPQAVAIALLVAFAFTNAFVMLLHAHARDVLPDRLVGRGLTLENLAAFLGIAVLQSVSGIIVEHFGGSATSAPPEAYRAVFWFLLGASTLALLAYWPVDDAKTST